MEQDQRCPFCPLMGIEPDQYQSIGNDLYGEPALVGNIRSCEDCATVAFLTETTQELLEALHQGTLVARDDGEGSHLPLRSSEEPKKGMRR